MDKNLKFTNLLEEQINSAKKETRCLEFKSNYQEAIKLGRYISALSNGACLEHQDFAYLYFAVEYSKHKGLDSKSCEILLLDSLKDHGKLTRTEIDELLWNVLSDQLNEAQKKSKNRKPLT